MRKHERTGVLSTVMLMLIVALPSICGAKSYKVIVGYEKEEMEILLTPGRSVPTIGGMPSPSSSELNSSFPAPLSVQTVAPVAPPGFPSSPREAVGYEIPRKSGFAFPPDFGVVTTQDIQTNIDSVGRAIIYGVNFEFDSAELTSSSIPALESLLGYLKNNPGVRFLIEGHCDTSGDTSLNPVLSQKRADAVKEWVVSRGAKGFYIKTVGRSDTQPIADNSTPEGRAKNRRVVLVKE